MESKIRDNPIFNTHLHLLYQISNQWMYSSFIFQKKMDSTMWMQMLKKTLQNVFEEKIVILKEYPKETRIQLHTEWKHIYECMTEKHILPTKWIFQSFSYWNPLFCKTNRAIYDLFAEMVNCYNHMHSYYEDQHIKWNPYYRKSGETLNMEKEGEYFVILFEYFLMLLEISIQNEEKEDGQFLNGGNYILHVLDIGFHFQNVNTETIEDFFSIIYDFPMKDIFQKEGFIYEPSDFKRHYDEVSFRTQCIMEELPLYYDKKVSFDQMKKWTQLTREISLIQQMKFTHYIPDVWIQQLHTIMKSIYEKKGITKIDYTLIYFRIQWIRFFLSRIHFV